MKWIPITSPSSTFLCIFLLPSFVFAKHLFQCEACLHNNHTSATLSNTINEALSSTVLKRPEAEKNKQKQQQHTHTTNIFAHHVDNFCHVIRIRWDPRYATSFGITLVWLRAVAFVFVGFFPFSSLFSLMAHFGWTLNQRSVRSIASVLSSISSIFDAKTKNRGNKRDAKQDEQKQTKCFTGRTWTKWIIISYNSLRAQCKEVMQLKRRHSTAARLQRVDFFLVGFFLMLYSRFQQIFTWK